MFHFDSPPEVYTADACVITCFDARFDQAIRKFLKRRGVVLFDHVKIPGSAKPWAAEDADGAGDFLLQAVRTSMRLHNPRRAVIVAHNDCGAYPGVAPEVVAGDAVRAARFLRKAEPSLDVESYFADFDGIYRIE
ncbi:MAG TPA: carbonic anhydrase [Bryobacteraceae bacterium]|nr:carbonic anhydrase [Bryobacteraceae bacterium]